MKPSAFGGRLNPQAGQGGHGDIAQDIPAGGPHKHAQTGFKAAEHRDPYHPQQDVDQRGQGGPFPAQDIGGEVEGQGAQGDGCGADRDGEGADCGDNRRHHSGHGQRVNLVFCSDLHSEGQPFYSKIVNHIF